MTVLYQNRQEAGRLLAAALEKYADRNDVAVLALSCGGMPVAVEVAEFLSAPLDMLVIQPISVPMHDAWQGDRTMGTLTSGGALILNSEVVDALHISDREVEQAVAFAHKELNDKERASRGIRPFPDIRGRIVILVDDSIETVAAARAGIEAMRLREAKRVTVSAPVGAACVCQQLARDADELICLRQLDCAFVPRLYGDSPLVTDEEAHALLEQTSQNQRVRGEGALANQGC